MTLYQIKDGVAKPWDFSRINGIAYPRNISKVWTDAELAAVGLFKPVPAVVPDGYEVTATNVALVDGVVSEVVTTALIVATRQQVKEEAARRILAIFPEWKQRNMNAQATAILQARVLNGSLTAEEQALSDSLNAAWAAVSAIRLASDTLEAMDPIPLDYADNKYWP